jgi:hypothetical protein
MANGGLVDYRDVDVIDRELVLVAAVAASIRQLGGTPSTTLIDELVDERIASQSSPQRKHRRRSS